ncbi:hypothetical protein HPP92_016647 [Vanilla planifolia]|uniref:gibberellin 2beta-dioxygenase n=1 Tax=Vanilla planifolia TaxID=51239 RepID=A0A835QF58_VANPL|nr:hypothetical protein HPP92_016647 [Vanilla planifolia]
MVAITSVKESRERVVSSDIPEIDLQWKRDKARKLMVRACEEFGIFKVINHGVPKEIIENIEKEGKNFFSLPASDKQKAGPPNPLGYGSKQIGYNGDMGDLEYLLFHTNPTSIYQRLRTTTKDAFKFSCVVNDYVDKVRKLACDLLEMLGEGLGLEDTKTFSKLVMDAESDSLVRLNYYPCCEGNSKEKLGIIKKKDDKGPRIGFGDHSDPQIITLLRSNEVEGLQIQSPWDSSVWIPVKSDASAFFINVGDALQAMTNGRLTSVRHRAIVNTQKTRMSTIFFASPSLQTLISPLPEMVTHEKPHKYRPYTWAEYKRIMYSLKLATNRLELFLSDYNDNTGLLRLV